MAAATQQQQQQPPHHTTWCDITIKGQIHPDTVSQLCCCHCCHSPLAVKKKKKACHLESHYLKGPIMFALTVRIQSNEPPKPPYPIDDSTSALDYKTSHKVRPPLLPKMDLPRLQSTEEVVTNTLYNTPPPSLITLQIVSPPCFFFPLAAATAMCLL